MCVEKMKDLDHGEPCAPSVDVVRDGSCHSNPRGSVSSLVSKNITVFGRRTSVRLEPEMWNAIDEISSREKCTIHDICSLVFIRKSEGTSLTAAIRVFLMLYFRAATTEQGHISAGHGDFINMKSRAQIPSEFEGFFKKGNGKCRYEGKPDRKTG